jgi:hypothetical protein
MGVAYITYMDVLCSLKIATIIVTDRGFITRVKTEFRESAVRPWRHL